MKTIQTIYEEEMKQFTIGKKVKFIKKSECDYDYGTGKIIEIEEAYGTKRYVVKLDKRPNVPFASDELCFWKNELEIIE